MSEHRSCLVAFLVTLVTFLLARPVQVQAQQTGEITGQVVSVSDLAPLAGVQVLVNGTGIGTITNNTGRYLLNDVPVGTVVVRATMVGHSTQEQTVDVTAGATTVVDFELREAAIAIDEIVVTGVPGGTRRRAIGNTVTTIDAAALSEVAPIEDVETLLTGRSPGVVIVPSTGAVGAGSTIRIRGSSTISLTGNPLIYIDGVRVANSATTGPASQGGGRGAGTISRLNDIDPQSIESIEVLKGPAAATLYGTEASRGVINIITKRGSAGPPSLSVSVRQGVNWLPNPESLFPVNYWTDPDGRVHSLNIVEREKSLGRKLFRTGRLQTYRASLSGGSEDTRYYVSGSFTDDEGPLPTNWLKNLNSQVNVDVQLRDGLRITTSNTFVKNDVRLNREVSGGSIMWGVAYATPQNLPENRCRILPGPSCDTWRGFGRGTPQTWLSEHHEQHVRRYVGSVQVTYEPFDWLTNRLSVGLDATEEQNLSYRLYQTNDTIRSELGDREANGFRFQERWRRFHTTYDFASTVNVPLTEMITSATSWGIQYYTRHEEVLAARGEEFANPGLSTIAATASQPLATDNFIQNNTLGTYLQETLSWRDRLFLIGAVRVDNNSAFGDEVRWVTYPKASLSWVLNEEEWYDDVAPSWANGLRLRIAWGQSGEQPPSFVALRTYQPVPAEAGTGVSPNTIGNPDLAPEVGEELEVGLDTELLDNRIGLQFSYYHKRTKDAILLRQLAPSNGFPGARFINAGSILNQGVELELDAQVLSGQRFAWDVGVNLSTNRGEIERLSGEPGDTAIIFGFRNMMEHRVGYAPFSYFWQRVVRAELDPETNRPVNVMCDDGDGGVMPCYDDDGNVIAPRLYQGRAIPPIALGISTDLTLLNRIELHALLDLQLGHTRFDNTTRIRCHLFRLCRETAFPDDADPVLLAQYDSNDRLLAYGMADSGFARLREVSLSYSLPNSVVERMGIAGARLRVSARNLLTITNWTGLDPESAVAEGYSMRQFMEQHQLPATTRFETSLRVDF